MSNQRHMTFILLGGPPLDMEDLASQFQEGKPVTYNTREVGRTTSATATPNSLQVAIELFTLEIPPVIDLRIHAVPKDLSAELGSSLTIRNVEALIGE